MTKLELVAKIAEKAELSKKDTAAFVDAFVETVKETLQTGEKIQMVGFGTFEVVERAARTGRNPSTGEEMEIPACKAPKFKASKNLKDCIKE